MNLPLWKTRFYEYLRMRNLAERTAQGYCGELRPFFEYLEVEGVKSIGGITRDLVDGYRELLFRRRYRGKRIGMGAQSKRLSAVKCFTRFLTVEHFIPLDPALDVELPRVPRTLPKTLLSEREAERLIEAPDVTSIYGIRDRAMLEVFYCTAIRNQEMRNLALSSVDFETATLRVDMGKGGKSRLLPLGEEAIHWLREYLARARPHMAPIPDEGVLFVTKMGRKFGRANLSKQIRLMGNRAGLKKRVTPHVLRCCCATHMLRHGAGLRHLQELMGHASPDTTQRYIRLEVSDLRAVLQRCHPREKKS